MNHDLNDQLFRLTQSEYITKYYSKDIREGLWYPTDTLSLSEVNDTAFVNNYFQMSWNVIQKHLLGKPAAEYIALRSADSLKKEKSKMMVVVDSDDHVKHYCLQTPVSQYITVMGRFDSMDELLISVFTEECNDTWKLVPFMGEGDRLVESEKEEHDCTTRGLEAVNWIVY